MEGGDGPRAEGRRPPSNEARPPTNEARPPTDCPESGVRAGIAKAAWQLEDAVQVAGRVLDHYPEDINARDEHVLMTKWEVYSQKALIGMFALSVFEMPPWCERGRSGSTSGFFIVDQEACFFDGEVLLSGVPYLTPLFGLAIEVCLMAVMTKCTLMKKKIQEAYFPEEHEARLNILVALAMLALELADCVIWAIFRPSFRIAFLSRTAYMCLQPAIGELFHCLTMCIKEFLSVAVFLVGVMLFYTWILLVVLRGDTEGEDSDDFLEWATPGSALNAVFVAGVSDDFVSVLQASYKTYRLLGLLWLSFLVIVNVLLRNLVLDTLVVAYTTFAEETDHAMAKDKVDGMRKSFKTLADATSDSKAKDGGGQHVDMVSEQHFQEFIAEYSRSYRVSEISSTVAEAAFQAADTDESGYIDVEEFCCFFCFAVQYRLTSYRTYSPLKDRCPAAWEKYAWLREFIEGVSDGEDDGDQVSTFDRCMYFVLGANFVLMIVELYYTLELLDDPWWVDILEPCFTIIYLIQIVLKLMIFSWGEYMADFSNVFDFFTTTVLLITGFFGRQLARYANMLRVFRLLRVIRSLKSLPPVQFLAKVIVELIVASKAMMTLLAIVVFFFTMFSVQLFGGLLKKGEEKLEGTDYLEKGMLALNCNDVPSAIGVWVVMIFQEYQPAFGEAVSRVETIRKSWFIFPIFWLTGVCITFELVKAFTIEVFMALQEGKEEEEKEKDKEDRSPSRVDEMKKRMTEELRSQGQSFHLSLIGSLEAYHETIEVLFPEEGHHHGHGHGHEGHDGHGEGAGHGGGHGHGGAEHDDGHGGAEHGAAGHH